MPTNWNEKNETSNFSLQSASNEHKNVLLKVFQGRGRDGCLPSRGGRALNMATDPGMVEGYLVERSPFNWDDPSSNPGIICTGWLFLLLKLNIAVKTYQK